MRKIFIVVIILLVSSFYSCSPNYLKGFSELKNSDLKIPTVFNKQLKKVMYKANLSVMGNELSGILLIKNVNPSEYRLVFMSELGIKYFDLGIDFKNEKPKFTNYYLIAPMQRGEVEKILFNDFSVLLGEFANNISFNVFRDQNTKIAIANSFDSYNYYSFRYSGKDKIESIKWSAKPEGKSMLKFSDYEKDIPGTIILENAKYSTSLSLKIMRDK